MNVVAGLWSAALLVLGLINIAFAIANGRTLSWVAGGFCLMVMSIILWMNRTVPS